MLPKSWNGPPLAASMPSFFGMARFHREMLTAASNRERREKLLRGCLHVGPHRRRNVRETVAPMRNKSRKPEVAYRKGPGGIKHGVWPLSG